MVIFAIFRQIELTFCTHTLYVSGCRNLSPQNLDRGIFVCFILFVCNRCFYQPTFFSQIELSQRGAFCNQERPAIGGAVRNAMRHIRATVVLQTDNHLGLGRGETTQIQPWRQKMIKHRRLYSNLLPTGSSCYVMVNFEVGNSSSFRDNRANIFPDAEVGGGAGGINAICS